MAVFKLKDNATMTVDNMIATVTQKDGRQTTLDHAITTALNNGIMDADGAFFFQRQLEYIKAKSYDVKYAELKARQLFPVSNEGGHGISTITYRTYDQAGMAKIIEGYADDLPRADVSGKETSVPVRSVGTSYGYNLDEIQASQLTGASLDQRRANAAMRSNEQVINNVAFFGDSSSNLPGLFNNKNVTSGSVVATGAGNKTTWTSKTPEQILFDVNEICSDIFNNSQMVEQPNTLLIPPKQWAYIMSTARSIRSDTTIAQYLVQNSPYLKSLDDIVAVNECASKNHNLFSGRNVMVAYDKNPDKLQLEIPVELEMLPVQQKNLEFIVPGRSRLAGLNIYYPLSVSLGLGI